MSTNEPTKQNVVERLDSAVREYNDAMAEAKLATYVNVDLRRWQDVKRVHEMMHWGAIVCPGTTTGVIAENQRTCDVATMEHDMQDIAMRAIENRLNNGWAINVNIERAIKGI